MWEECDHLPGSMCRPYDMPWDDKDHPKIVEIRETAKALEKLRPITSVMTERHEQLTRYMRQLKPNTFDLTFIR